MVHESKVVVTAIYGDHDTLKPVRAVGDGWAYVVFTDNPRLGDPSGTWRIIHQPSPHSSTRAAREIKIRLHHFVPNAELTVWIDGSFELLVSPQVLAEHLRGSSIACHRHPERGDIYSEGKTCVARGKDDPKVIAAQLDRYRERGYQSHWLTANGIIVRRMDEATRELGEHWWQEMAQGSHRDQLSFPVVCDELGIVVQMIPGNIFKSPFAKLHKHKRRLRWPNTEPATEHRIGNVKHSVIETLRASRGRPYAPPKLHVHIPYDPQMDVGRAYNRAMGTVGDDEWAVFMDHDAMFTTVAWYHQIAHAIEKRPGAGAFTAVTNRIGNKRQRAAGVSDTNHDIRYHRQQGARLFERHYAEMEDITDDPSFSGVLIVISKAAWKRIGGFKSGFLGVDTRAHVELREHGYRIYLLRGLYLYHWYRGAGKTAEHMSLLGPADRLRPRPP